MLRMLCLGLFAGLAAAAPAAAQIQTIDPNHAAAYQAPAPAPGDVQPGYPADSAPVASEYQPIEPQGEVAADPAFPTTPEASPTSPSTANDAQARANAAISGDSVPREDVFTAAEGVFGKGAAGLAEMIESLLAKQGEPNAYISGREAGGAFVVGVRYGSGTLHHQVEGDRPVYWTGPSVGFDVGANADKVFVLVYNLYDSQDIYKAYPAAEGNVHAIGGFTASYLRRGDVVLIPIRLGVGLRLGVNAGYMRFSEKARWLPF